MNTKYPLMAGLVLGCAMLAGCPERPEARPAPDRAPTTPAPTTPPRDGVGVDQDAQARAQTLIQRANQEINAGNFQGAEQTLQELELMRHDLTQAQQREIDQLRERLRQDQPGMQPQPAQPAQPGATEPY